jgi:hypothetical protein
MRNRLIAITGGLIGLLLLPGTAPAQAERRTEERLVGTWERISPKVPDQYRHIKHVTPTHWTWVFYERAEMSVVGAAGGTWSLQGDTYKEQIEFADDSSKSLRGRNFSFTSKLDGDEWSIKSLAGSDLQVDEVWKRVGLR